jgi:hypothetical protein
MRAAFRHGSSGRTSLTAGASPAGATTSCTADTICRRRGHTRLTLESFEFHDAEAVYGGFAVHSRTPSRLRAKATRPLIGRLPRFVDSSHD